MFKLVSGIVLLGSILLISCGQRSTTEQANKAFWDAAVIDSSYRLLYKNKDTVQALRYFDAALQRANSNQPRVYPKAARFALLANYYYFFSTDNTATARMIDAALAVYNSSELQNRYPRNCVYLLLFGGDIAYRLAEYNKANDYYFRAKKLGDAHLSPCERKAFNYSIAMVLYRQENYAQSLAYFKQAFSLQESCTPQTTAVILQQQEIQSNIGLCLVHLKQYDVATVHFDRALHLSEQYKDSLGRVTMDKIYGVIYGNKAKIALAQNRFDDAEALMRKSLALNDREGFEVEDAAAVKLQLAELYGRKKDYGAMAETLRSIDTARSASAPTLRLEWNRLMAVRSEQTAQADSALRYFKRYFLLRDSLADVQKRLVAADVVRQLRDKEQEGQIEVLKEDRRHTLISLEVTVVFSVMALVIMLLVYLNYRRSKKSLAESLSLNKEIRRQKSAREEEVKQRHKLITEAVIRAQEKERSLIGLELHDNVNQVLTTVKLHNEMLLDGIGDPKQLLPRTVKYLQECIDEIRSLSRRLSAPTLGKISLEDSVKELIDSVNQTSKVKITHSIIGFDRQVPRHDVHMGVYRILQEQLNNVLKHAEASEVLVRLERKDVHLALTVSDNGKGFATPNSKNGIGLLNMQTRAENLNGSFELFSEPGKGCTLTVLLPYVE